MSGPDRRQEWEARYTAGPVTDLPWHHEAPDPVLVEAVARGRLPRSGWMLDLGCGTGSDLLYLLDQGYRAVGVDLSVAALVYAGQRLLESGLPPCLVGADALRLPFPAACFSAVLDQGCFHGLPPELRAGYAGEVARVLAPEGRLFLRCFHDRQDAPPPEDAPPLPARLSLADLTAALGHHLRLIEAGEHRSETGPPDRGRRHVLWWRKRQAPLDRPIPVPPEAGADALSPCISLPLRLSSTKL